MLVSRRHLATAAGLAALQVVLLAAAEVGAVRSFNTLGGPDFAPLHPLVGQVLYET